MQTYTVHCYYTARQLGAVQANTLLGAKRKASKAYGHLSGGLYVRPAVQ